MKMKKVRPVKTLELSFAKALEALAQLNIECCSACSQSTMIFDFAQEAFVCQQVPLPADAKHKVEVRCINRISLNNTVNGKD